MQFLSKKIFDVMAPFIGGLLALSFSPFDLSYLVFPTLAFLMVSWQVLTPGRAALRGWLFGLGWFGLGISWVFVSVHDYGGASLMHSVLLTALFVSFWALFPALTGYLASFMRRWRGPWSQLLLFPCLWVLMEYVRGYWFLNGFPWLQISYTQLESPLAGFVPILGVYGSGFIVALISVCVGHCLCGREKRRYGILVIAVWLWGGLLKYIQWTYPIGDDLTVSLIQGNIAQDRKWAPGNKSATLAKYKAMTEAHWQSDLVIWPETAIPAYFSEVNDNFLVPLTQEAVRQKTDIVVSLPMQSEETDKNYNAVLVLGQTPGIYKKQHLLPFGEYLPLQPFSGYVLNALNIQLGHFIPGADDQKLLVAAGYPFITSICYEDAFGSQNIDKLDDAAFLVNVTNDAWFGQSIEPYQHMQIARMRALETGRYLLRATNTGVTGIVAPDGTVVNRAPIFNTAVVTGVMTPMGGVTPYARIGDTFLIVWITVSLGALIADNVARGILGKQA